MRKVTLPIEKLFSILGMDNISNDLPNAVIPDIFVRDPFGDVTRINYLIKKIDNKIKLSFEDGSVVHCGEKHIMQSSMGLGFAKDISDAYNIRFDDYLAIIEKTNTEMGFVFDISINDPHLYVTPNGFVHHNTTLAKALCHEMDLDFILINASENGNIDTIRTTIRSYASTMSFTSKYKVVILDEADFLNACFTADQKIKVIEHKDIVERSIGELCDTQFTVLSYDFKKRKITANEAHALETTIKEVFKVTMEDKSEITCTRDHPFFNFMGNNATIDDGELFRVILNNGITELLGVESIKSLGFQTVFDVSVHNDLHNFLLANGVVAHNSSSQPALRGFIEEFSKNCRFVFTANFLNRIIEPLRSRCPPIEFSFTKQEKQQMIVEFDQRIKEILRHENVIFDKKELAQIVVKYFPDFRRIINVLQHATSGGELQSGTVSNINSDNIKLLFSFLKDSGQWKNMRKWVVDNSDIDSNLLFRSIYDNAETYIMPSSIPQLVLTLSQYEYRGAFVADHEVNIVAALTEIMAQCEFL